MKYVTQGVGDEMKTVSEYLQFLVIIPFVYIYVLGMVWALQTYNLKYTFNC